MSERLAVVTGATGSLGSAYARRLARSGHRLVLIARNAVALDEIADDLASAYGNRPRMLVADLTDDVDLREVGDQLAAADVDFLVNNAATMASDGLASEPGELGRELALNFTAPVLTTGAVLPGMLDRDRGTVVNVASMAALMPGSGLTYAAAKTGVLAFTEGLATAHRDTGLRFQALCPNVMATDLFTRSGGDIEAVPAPFRCTPDEVVAQSLTDLERDRLVSVARRANRIMTTVLDLLPRRAASAVVRRTIASSQRG